MHVRASMLNCYYEYTSRLPHSTTGSRERELVGRAHIFTTTPLGLVVGACFNTTPLMGGPDMMRFLGTHEPPPSSRQMQVGRCPYRGGGRRSQDEGGGLVVNLVELTL